MTHYEWRGCSIEMDLTGIELRGVWEFRQDLTYRVDLRTNGDWVLKGQAHCNGDARSCEEVQRLRRQMLEGTGADDTDVTCTGTTLCICTHTLKNHSVRATGAYVVADGSVALSSDNRLDYCVTNDTLELRAIYGKGALGPDHDLSGILVLVRQK